CHAALTRLFDYYLAASAAAMDGLAPALRHRRPDPPPTAAPLPDVGEATRARAWLDKELATLATVAAHTAGHGWPTHTTRLADTISGSYLDIDHYTDGVVILRHAVAAAQSCGNDAAQARALIGLGHIHSRGGRPGQAARCLGQAIDLAASTDDRLLQARSLGASASASSLQGHYRQARERYDRARALYREVGDRLGEAVNLTNVGLLDLRQGCYHQAAGHYQQALVLLREIGHRFAEANALHNLGEAYCRQGAYEQAVTYQRQAVAVAREVGSSYIEAHALNGLADVWHRRGSYDEASTSRQQSLALFAEVGDRAGESDALNGAGETLLATGQPEQAYKCHSKALALAREAGSQREEARALARLGETCRARGEPGQAASHHEAALTLYRQIGDRGGEADALNGDGEALLAAGQAAQAQACHSAALALTDQTGDRYQQARALAGLAAACHAMGEREQARRHGEQAREVFGELGVPSVVALPTVPAVPGLAASSRLASARPSPRVGLMLVSSAGPGRAGPDPVVPEPAPPGLRFKILGPLEVCDGEAACTPTAPKVRRVFALLLLQTNQVVPTGSLIEELWGQEPPHSATTTVATYIYQLRRAFSQRQVSLGVRDWLVTAAPGYLLRVSPEQVDAHAFKALSRQGRQLLESGQPQAAADVLRRALDLWRGPALANVTTGRLLAGHAVHLEEERLRTLELRILADAELGRHHALVGELRALVAVHPLNEWLHGQLIAALSRSGRRSEALQAYRHLQALLRDELGLDPHPGLQRLHQDVLNDDLPQAPLFGLSVPSATLR
ncbi:MAG TPA: tetratricopeptide repeat protein, partial [Streptosporangiaceae bacterium]|nr:tetratricopeptide repeat protein [Streptosporangiaceae bacterium]